MRIGILSETHGHIGRTLEAIALLQAEKPAMIIHCGDIGSAAVLGELVAAFQPENVCIHAVLGNVDYPDDIYDEWLQPGVLEIPGRFADLTVMGKRIAIIHGDDDRRLQLTLAAGDYDYVFTGHTHSKSDRWVHTTRVINPGAVYRARLPSVAILDLSTGTLRYLDLPQPIE